MPNRKSRKRFYPLSRDEHDAKINASESRINSKLTEIKADIKSLTTTVDAMKMLLIEYREDSRVGRWAIWALVTAITLGFSGTIASIIFK